MLTIRDHRVGDYAELADMDATDVGVLTEDDRTCLDELAEYLVDADGSQRFALWLLHKHFVPEPGEVFVERAIPSPPQMHTTVIDRTAYSPDGLQAVSVRFDTEVTSGVGLIGMEFAGPADFGPTSPIGPEDEAVLAGLAGRLQSHGKIDRFGVRLIRNPLGLSEDQDLLETCDKTRRALHCAVVDKASLPAESAIATTWEAKTVSDESGRVATVWCGGKHCYHS